MITTEQLKESIIKSEMSEEFAKTEFGFLRDTVAAMIKNGLYIQNIEVFLREGEDAYMLETYGDDPEARWQKATPRHPLGSWKYSLLPKNYQSNKSVILGAAKAGIPLEGQGKTSLQYEVKAAKNGTVPSSPEQSDNLKTYKKYFRKIASLVERMTVEEYKEAAQMANDLAKQMNATLEILK